MYLYIIRCSQTKKGQTCIHAHILAYHYYIYIIIKSKITTATLFRLKMVKGKMFFRRSEAATDTEWNNFLKELHQPFQEEFQKKRSFITFERKYRQQNYLVIIMKIICPPGKKLHYRPLNMVDIQKYKINYHDCYRIIGQ